MKLLTKELLNQFEKQPVDGGDNVKIICKFFNPSGGQTWYAIEYNPQEKMFFGFADLGFKDMEEFGYFGLEELESIKCPPFGLGIERDLYFEPMTVKQLKNQYNINW